VTQTGISVVDQFGSSTTSATRPKFFCDAASVNGSIIDDPSAGLCCYERPALNFAPPRHVQTTDGFGVLQLDAKKGTLLCQSCSSTPHPSACAALDHFQCYETDLRKGSKFIAQKESIHDRFESVVINASRPGLFCSASSQDGSVVHDPSTDLCCYDAVAGALPVPILLPIEDEFGSLTLQLKKSTMLCGPCGSVNLP
jgi:hypothetical protein